MVRFVHDVSFFFFFFNDTATTEIYTLSLHDALPLLERQLDSAAAAAECREDRHGGDGRGVAPRIQRETPAVARDRDDPHARRAREPGGDPVARPVQRRPEHVEPDPEVRDGRGSEHRNGSTALLHQVATTRCNALTALSRSFP